MDLQSIHQFGTHISSSSNLLELQLMYWSQLYESFACAHCKLLNAVNICITENVFGKSQLKDPWKATEVPCSSATLTKHRQKFDASHTRCYHGRRRGEMIKFAKRPVSILSHMEREVKMTRQRLLYTCVVLHLNFAKWHNFNFNKQKCH